MPTQSKWRGSCEATITEAKWQPAVANNFFSFVTGTNCHMSTHKHFLGLWKNSMQPYWIHTKWLLSLFSNKQWEKYSFYSIQSELHTTPVKATEHNSLWNFQGNFTILAVVWIHKWCCRIACMCTQCQNHKWLPLLLLLKTTGCNQTFLELRRWSEHSFISSWLLHCCKKQWWNTWAMYIKLDCHQKNHSSLQEQWQAMHTIKMNCILKLSNSCLQFFNCFLSPLSYCLLSQSHVEQIMQSGQNPHPSSHQFVITV